MDDSNSIIHEPCATQAESQLQNSNADDDDAGSDASEQHAGERRQRCRGKNKIQPVVEGGLQRFICPLCKTGFDQQHQLTMHIRAHNSGGTAVNQCTLCGKQLSSQSSLDRHMLVHSGERPFCCRICAMSFTTNGNMHRHMAVHEKDMPAEWKAMMSEKRRRRKSAKLAKSDASATSTSVESGCSSAPAEPGAGQAAAFANLNAMWLSQVPFLETLSKFLTPLPASTTHSEADADADADANADADSDSDQMTDMPEADDVKSISTPHEHQGSVNSQQDATNENLDDVDVDVKMVNVEDTNDDRPRLRIVSESESGPNSFAESSNLNSLNPEESAAPQTERSGAQKPRKCRFCTLTFPTVNALRLHVRSHHGLSPFRCQVCEYTSVDKSTLVRHMRTHNGQRPFRCTECGYAFTTKANCERHVKTRHQKTTKQELLGAVAIVSAAQSPSSQSCQSHSTSASAGSSCRFLCCRKRMSSWRLVNRHVRMRHAKRKTLFTAAKPPLEFATTQALSTGSDQDTKVDVDVEVDDIKHEAEPTEQLQLAVNCVQNAPLVASAFDYASWFNLVGAFHKLAATNLPTVDCDVRCDDYSEQTEPLDLTVKQHAEAHAGNNSLSVGIGFGAPQYDSGFSSAKTLSPDGPFEMRTDAGAPLGSLALLAFYQNVLAASNQFALTSASQCAPSASAFTTARSLDGGTLIDAHSHSHSHNEFDYSAESLRSDENETRDERPDSQNDVELDVCDNDQSGAGARAEADSLAKQDDDGDGDGDGNAQHSYSQSDASCAQQTADEALSETEVGASKKKRNSYSDSPRRIQCPYCTRSFPWISSLKRHLITHTGQKPFRCPRCSLNFSTKSNRERHLQRKHGVKVHGSSGSLNVTIGKSDERTNESALTATNLSGSTATLEDNELRDMTVADSIADAIGENLLKNASLVMSPNVSRTGARKSNDDVKLVLDVRQCRRADNKKCDTPTRS